MRAALFIEPHRVEAGDRRDPVIVEPTDAIVQRHEPGPKSTWSSR
jgi:hypothetical protein